MQNRGNGGGKQVVPTPHEVDYGKNYDELKNYIFLAAFNL